MAPRVGGAGSRPTGAICGASSSRSTADPQAAVPARIAGFPFVETEISLGDARLTVCTVDRLEELVDRERLLSETDVPDPPYWAHLWVGARALAREILSGAPLAGKRVLDLGCGLGLAGLAAALRGAEVWFADKEPAALEFVRESARRNGFRDVTVCALDFTRDVLAERFDVVLGAEVVYDPAAYDPLAAFVDRHLVPDGVFHVTDAFRSDAVCFFDRLTALGFHGERRAAREWDDGRWHGLFLWSFRR